MSGKRGVVVKRILLLLISFGSVAVITAEDTGEQVQLIRYDGSPVNTSVPRFCWHAFKDAEEYGIEIADNPDFGCSYIKFVNDTCVTYEMELDEGVWYWRVSSSDHFLSHSPADSLKVTTTLTTRMIAERRVTTSLSLGRAYLVNGRRFSEDQSQGVQTMITTNRTTVKCKTSVGSMRQTVQRDD